MLRAKRTANRRRPGICGALAVREGGAVTIRARVALAAALGTAAAMGPAWGQAGQVGVAAAVNPDAVGTPLGAAQRVIQVGLDMQRNERVSTGPQGRTQMLFIDGSALTVGPSSEVVLDEFVYDPAAESGKIALSATRGLFRVVGGKISKNDAITIRTPTALIGVRGGIAVLEVGESTRAQFLFGQQMTVESGGVVREVGRPGFEITAGPSAAPSEPAPLTEQSVSLGGFEGVSGSTGGAVQAPTDENVASTQIATLGSGNAPAVVASGPASSASTAQAQSASASIAGEVSDSQQTATTQESNVVATTMPTAQTTLGGRFLSQTPFTNYTFADGLSDRVAGRNENFSGGTLALGRFRATLPNGAVDLPATRGAFTFTSGQGSTPFGPVSGTGFLADDLSFLFYNLLETQASNNPSALVAGVPFTGTFPTSGIRAFTLTPSFPGTHLIPFLDADFGGRFNTSSYGPLYIAYSPNLATFPNDARSTAAFGLVVIEGRGSSQRSAEVSYAGTLFADDVFGKPTLSGFANNSVRLGATGRAIRKGSGGSSAADGAGNSFFGLSDPDYFGVDSYFAGGINGITRQDAAGFVQTFENLSASSKTFFQTQIAQRTALPSGVGASRTARIQNGYTGGIFEVFNFSNGMFLEYMHGSPAGDPTKLSITTDPSTNRLAAVFQTRDVQNISNGFFDVQVRFGGLTGVLRSRAAFIDDDIFVARQEFGTTPITLIDPAMVMPSSPIDGRADLLTSAFYVDRGAVPPDVSLCACAFLTWGFWDVDTFSSSRRSGHLEPWMAGELPNAADIPASGSASYAGHVVADVSAAGLMYTAFGNYHQTWSFDQRTGSVQITKLDGADYSGMVSSGNGREFSGSIGGAGRSGAMTGSFFRNGADPAGGVGGNFYLSGPSYRAAGIAVGQRQ